MEKHSLISTTLFLTLTVGYSQTNIYHPFPDSAVVWNMHFVYGFCNNAEAYYSITISGDTLISSQTYHKLTTPYVQVVYNPGCPLPSIGYKGAIRQDTTNRKVFFVPPSNNTEQLLYDFNMQVGDTVKGYIETVALPAADTVQSIDSVLVGSNYHKRWKINSCYNIYFIEGIGSTYGLIEWSPGCITDQLYYSITCFNQNGFTLYPSTTTNCNLITSVNSIEKNLNEIKIFPNPFSTQTTLQTDKLFKDATLTVYNSFGQQVKQIKNISGQTITLQRDNLPSGLYFIRLTQDNKIISADKLVITDLSRPN